MNNNNEIELKKDPTEFLRDYFPQVVLDEASRRFKEIEKDEAQIEIPWQYYVYDQNSGPRDDYEKVFGDYLSKLVPNFTNPTFLDLMMARNSRKVLDIMAPPGSLLRVLAGKTRPANLLSRYPFNETAVLYPELVTHMYVDKKISDLDKSDPGWDFLEFGYCITAFDKRSAEQVSADKSSNIHVISGDTCNLETWNGVPEELDIITFRPVEGISDDAVGLYQLLFCIYQGYDRLTSNDGVFFIDISRQRNLQIVFSNIIEKILNKGVDIEMNFGQILIKKSSASPKSLPIIDLSNNTSFLKLLKEFTP